MRLLKKKWSINHWNAFRHTHDCYWNHFTLTRNRLSILFWSCFSSSGIRSKNYRRKILRLRYCVVLHEKDAIKTKIIIMDRREICINKSYSKQRQRRQPITQLNYHGKGKKWLWTLLFAKLFVYRTIYRITYKTSYFPKCGAIAGMH